MLGEDAHSFFWDLAKSLEAVNEDRRSYQFLLQQVAVAVQRGNAASVLGSIYLFIFSFIIIVKLFL